ncbi:SDR family oxidoreductase [Nonomuraea typhae]|uniref:SDR family oxidoreductase n=1 Tax=Nonomuraea typhae TaxID=2603600 RepID=UPI0012F89708|nr:NAD-dependent epimerase/dehydratase family protein [Nonomuraea typhae]
MKIAVAGATGRLGRHVVDVITEQGHEAVAMSRGTGVDIVTGAGLAEALAGVDVVIDVASSPSPDEQEATEFFTTASANLQRYGGAAGVKEIVAVSIIGIDGSTGGYNAAKLVHEREIQAGPVPARVVRAAQFHELVGQMLEWGTRDGVAYIPAMRTQPIAARAVAETVVAVAVSGADVAEVAGPREESMVALAELVVARRGLEVKVQAVRDPGDAEAFEGGALLPGPGARLAGPAFADWLA